MAMEKNDALGSVSIEEKSGVGLPYAPVDWPNPGDVWTWKLGKRISNDGFYRDRFIFLPRRLHQKGKRKYLDSKKSIITYLQSKFPDTDVDAFFQSFTWKVPASFNTGEKVDKRGAISSGELQNPAQATPHFKKVHPRSKSETNGKMEYRRRSWRVVMSKASSKKRVRFKPKEVKDIIELSSWSNGTESCEPTADNSNTAVDSQNIQASSSQNTGSQNSKNGNHYHSPKGIPSKLIPNDSEMLIDSANNFVSQSLPKSSDVVNDQSATHYHSPKGIPSKSIANDSEMFIDSADNFLSQSLPKSSDVVNDQSATHYHSPKEIPSKSIANDGEMFIDSADNLLSQSLPKSSDVVNDQSATSQDKMFEARSKLLLLLATDNPVMCSSIKLSKIMHLWSLLKTDPNIDADRQGILKLIDEIPLAWKEFKKNKKISEAADKFSKDLETNIAWTTTLENEYNELKGHEYILHKELDSISLDIEKIDEQINSLQSRRDKLSSAADVKKKVVGMLISKQKTVAECLSKVVDEVEMGKKQRQEWERKMKMSEEQKAKILSKFDPLREGAEDENV